MNATLAIPSRARSRTDRIFPSERSPERLALLLPIALAIIAYANALWNGFTFDDVYIIQTNDRVHNILALRDIWLTPYWPWEEGEKLGLYRPLVIFLYAVQWLYGVGAPWLFHFCNLLFHASVTGLVFALLRRLGSRAEVAGLGAAVFAVHPVHVESVANVVGQAEVVAAAFMLLACIVYLGRHRETGLSLPRTLAIAALYLAGLLTKEHAVVLPGLLVLMHIADPRLERRERYGSRQLGDLGVLLLLLAAVVVGYFALRIDILGSITGADANPRLPYLREEHRVLSAFRAWPEYARLLFWPMDLIADYAPAVVLPVESWTPMTILGLGLLLSTVACAVVVFFRPGTGLPAAWFLITILPVSNLLFPVGVLLAERTLYLPSVAAALVVAPLYRVFSSMGPRARKVSAVVFAGLLVLFMARTIVRNAAWRDTETLMRTMLERHPESYRAQWRAAAHAAELGHFGESLMHGELGYRMWSRDPEFVAELAGFHALHGNPARAVQLARESLSEIPTYPKGWTALAMAHLRNGNPEATLRIADHLGWVFGSRAQVLEMRARALTVMGDDSAAVEAWEASMEVSAADWPEWVLYARALWEIGNFEESRRALEAAALRTDDDPAAVAAVRAGERALEEAAAAERDTL